MERGRSAQFRVPDRFIQFGSHSELMKEIGLDARVDRLANIAGKAPGNEKNHIEAVHDKTMLIALFPNEKKKHSFDLAKEICQFFSRARNPVVAEDEKAKKIGAKPLSRKPILKKSGF